MQRTLVTRWALGGFLLGAIWPAVAFSISASLDGTWSVISVHRAHPVLWLIDCAPVVLGGVGALIGAAHANLAALRDETHRIAERMAEELNAEIHDSNVDTARNAALQTKFFAALSHDMRTPLAAILGFSSLSEMDPERDADAGTLRTYLDEINGAADALLAMVNDLMDTARLGSGHIELQVADIDGDEIAAGVIRHLTPLAEEEGLVLFTDLRAAKDCRADPARLRQILVNLVSNAIKYTDEGSVIVRSRAAIDRVVYEVIDTGAGISAADKPLLFRPFEQTEAGRGRLDSTGLGLPVSLGLAQAMGGTIEVESSGAGLGSTFRLVLQRASGAESELCLASLPALAA